LGWSTSPVYPVMNEEPIFPYLAWYKQEYDLEKIKLNGYIQDDCVDKYLLKFSFQMKSLIKEYGDPAYMAMSTFLGHEMKEFKEYLIERTSEDVEPSA
jgi:hypothetical protein